MSDSTVISPPGRAPGPPPAAVEAPQRPPAASAGSAGRCARVLTAPWSRLVLLGVVLAASGVAALVAEPQRLLAQGWPPRLDGAAAALVFALAYGVCTAGFVPRPLLNLAAGAVLGSRFGLGAAVTGTVVGAGIAFGLGRLLGQDALRPLLRARVLKAADGQLSRHGFRSMMALRLFPGVPFWAANYAAAVSRVRWPAFLLATGIGSVPNTAAYVVTGARASAPLSPLFLAALCFLVLTGLAGAVVAWRGRHRLRGR